MSAFNRQEFDFIERTKNIINQYDNLQIQEKDKHEITLLLNCMFGLLILPQQHWFDFLPTELVSEKEWGIKPEHVSSIKKGETKNVKDITRHLRNSIAHYKFTCIADSNSMISQIKFEDFNSRKKKTFDATIPIANLKSFLIIFSNSITGEMKRQNN